MAGAGVRGKRLLPTVREALEPSTQAERPPHLGCNRGYREDVVRTYGDALFLAFTAIPVDDRPHSARRLFAVRFLDIQQAAPSNYSARSVERRRHFGVVCLGEVQVNSQAEARARARRRRAHTGCGEDLRRYRPWQAIRRAFQLRRCRPDPAPRCGLRFRWWTGGGR